jgi:hypothetical protein
LKWWQGSDEDRPGPDPFLASEEEGLPLQRAVFVSMNLNFFYPWLRTAFLLASLRQHPELLG